MEAKPSPQHEEPLAGLFTEAVGEGAETATADAAGGLGMQAKCDEIVQLMAHVQALFPADCPGADARTVVNALTDEGASDFAKIVAQVVRKCSGLELLSAGAVGTRSAKRAGQPGVAQAGGFKTGVEMMQHLTGSSWGEASRKVRVGQSMLAGETAEREAREQREALATRFGVCASDTGDGDGAESTADGSGSGSGGGAVTVATWPVLTLRLLPQRRRKLRRLRPCWCWRCRGIQCSTGPCRVTGSPTRKTMRSGRALALRRVYPRSIPKR